MEQISGTIFNYYFVCKRKCWLSYHKIGLEDNSEDVKIGKTLHKLKNSKNSEILIDGIKIDEITSEHIIEYKKTSFDKDSSIMQVLLYLYILEQKGIKLKAKVIFLEEGKEEEILLSNLNRKKVELSINEIKDLVERPFPPEIENIEKCLGCAFKDYCLI